MKTWILHVVLLKKMNLVAVKIYTMLFQEINNSVEKLKIEEISVERKQALQPMIEYIQCKVDNEKDINLNFICTHNSRRSHLSQIWAQVSAHYFNIKNVNKAEKPRSITKA